MTIDFFHCQSSQAPCSTPLFSVRLFLSVRVTFSVTAPPWLGAVVCPPGYPTTLSFHPFDNQDPIFFQRHRIRHAHPKERALSVLLGSSRREGCEGLPLCNRTGRESDEIVIVEVLLTLVRTSAPIVVCCTGWLVGGGRGLPSLAFFLIFTIPFFFDYFF